MKRLNILHKLSQQEVKIIENTFLVYQNKNIILFLINT